MTKLKTARAMADKMPMTGETRLTAVPIMRIHCKKSEALVGYLYKWNNGDLQPAWLDTAKAEVRYEPMGDVA